MMVISSSPPQGSPDLCPVCGSEIQIDPSNPARDAPCPACGHLVWFTWEAAGDSLVIKPICASLRTEDWETLMEKATEKQGVQITIDLRDVQSIASAVLGKLINFKKRAQAVQGTLKIENLHPDLVEIFRITRLDQVFDVGH